MDESTAKEKVGSGDVAEMMREIGRDVNVSLVYGEPQALEGRSLIPVARIHYAGGGGFGGGGGRQRAEEETELAGGEGHGVGAGLRVTAKPIGMVEVTSDSERWIPTLDLNRLIAIWSIVVGVVLVTVARGLFRMLSVRPRAMQ